MVKSQRQNKSNPTRKQEIGSNSYRVYMPKAGGIVWYQSYLEFLIALWFETRRDVVSAIPHGFVIEEAIGQRPKWTLDSLLHTQNGFQPIVEIKPSGQLVEDADGNMAPVGWDHLKEWCAKNGQQPIFYTEQVVVDNALLITNWLRIRPYLQLAHQIPDPKLDDLIEAVVDQAPQITLASIVKEIPAVSPQHVLAHLFYLLHAGRIYGDLESEALSPRTRFRQDARGSSVQPAGKVALGEPFPYLLTDSVKAPRTSDPQTWVPLPAALVDENERKKYSKRKAIVSARLIDNVSALNVAERYSVSVGEVYRLVKRCLSIGPNGEPWGWIGLIPNKKLFASEYDPANTSSSRGALTRLFERFPELKTELEDKFLNRNRKPEEREVALPHQDIWEFFLVECARLGVGADEWPNVAMKRGREALRVHLEGLKRTEFGAYTRGRWGAEAKRLLDARGVRNSEHTVRPYTVVQIDGAMIDAETAISVQGPDGTYIDLPAGRAWLLVAVCIASKAVIGWSITPMEQYNTVDVLDCVLACLEPWQLRTDSIVSDEYEIGAGLPNGVLEKCKWRSFDVLQLDNALAHISRESQERIIETIACSIHTGLPKTPTGRAVVERVIGTIARRSFQRVQSTTGSNPEDPRNLGASELAVKNAIHFTHVEDLTDVTICNLNVKASTATTGRSPIEYIAAWNNKESLFCRYVPNEIREEMPLHLRLFENVTIAGSVENQFSGYIEWKYCRYKNERITQDSTLIGDEVNLLVDVRDVRTAEVYSLEGEHLGEVEVQDRWRLHKHSLKERLLVGQWMKAQANEPQLTNPVGAFRTRTSALAGESKKARRALAKDRTGQNIEQTEEPKLPDVESDEELIENTQNRVISQPKRLTRKWVPVRKTTIRKG